MPSSVKTTATSHFDTPMTTLSLSVVEFTQTLLLKCLNRTFLLLKPVILSGISNGCGIPAEELTSREAMISAVRQCLSRRSQSWSLSLDSLDAFVLLRVLKQHIRSFLLPKALTGQSNNVDKYAVLEALHRDVEAVMQFRNLLLHFFPVSPQEAMMTLQGLQHLLAVLLPACREEELSEEANVYQMLEQTRQLLTRLCDRDKLPKQEGKAEDFPSTNQQETAKGEEQLETEYSYEDVCNAFAFHLLKTVSVFGREILTKSNRLSADTTKKKHRLLDVQHLLEIIAEDPPMPSSLTRSLQTAEEQATVKSTVRHYCKTILKLRNKISHDMSLTGKEMANTFKVSLRLLELYDDEDKVCKETLLSLKRLSGAFSLTLMPPSNCKHQKQHDIQYIAQIDTFNLRSHRFSLQVDQTSIIEDGETSPTLLERLPNKLWLLREAPEMVGREAEVEELVSALTPNPASSTKPRVLVTGVHGIGKTSIALQAVKDLRQLYPHQVLLDASSEDTLSLSLFHVEESLFMTSKPFPSQEPRRSLALLERVPTLLLVVDNVTEPRLLLDLLPFANHSLLFLSALCEVWEQKSLDQLRITHRLNLSALNNTDSFKLFKKAFETLPGRNSSIDRSDLCKQIGLQQNNIERVLCNDLQNIPLAVEMAGYLLSNGALSLSSFLQPSSWFFEVDIVEVESSSVCVGKTNVHGMTGIVEKALRSLEEGKVDMEIRSTLLVMAYVPHNGVPGIFVEDIVGAVSPNANFVQMWEDLQKFGLVHETRGEGVKFMHPFVQSVVKNKLRGTSVERLVRNTMANTIQGMQSICNQFYPFRKHDSLRAIAISYLWRVWRRTFCFICKGFVPATRSERMVSADDYLCRLVLDRNSTTSCRDLGKNLFLLKDSPEMDKSCTWLMEPFSMWQSISIAGKARYYLCLIGRYRKLFKLIKVAIMHHQGTRNAFEDLTARSVICNSAFGSIWRQLYPNATDVSPFSQNLKVRNPSIKVVQLMLLDRFSSLVTPLWSSFVCSWWDTNCPKYKPQQEAVKAFKNCLLHTIGELRCGHFQTAVDYVSRAKKILRDSPYTHCQPLTDQAICIADQLSRCAMLSRVMSNLEPRVDVDNELIAIDSLLLESNTMLTSWYDVITRPWSDVALGMWAAIRQKKSRRLLDLVEDECWFMKNRGLVRGFQSILSFYACRELLRLEGDLSSYLKMENAVLFLVVWWLVSFESHKSDKALPLSQELVALHVFVKDVQDALIRQLTHSHPRGVDLKAVLVFHQEQLNKARQVCIKREQFSFASKLLDHIRLVNVVEKSEFYREELP